MGLSIKDLNCNPVKLEPLKIKDNPKEVIEAFVGVIKGLGILIKYWYLSG